MTELRNDFPAGVLTGEAVNQVFALAKDQQFALPAANCIGTNSMNAVMETAGKLNSPVIIQYSTSGSAFVGGKNVPVDSSRASILGSVAGAKHVQTLAEAYDARVILHTDHCPKAKLPWISGLLDVGEEHFAATGAPLFSSHMLDLSEEPMEENLDICVDYLKRMTP
ncbi:MAG: class II fructose-bisphosphate aldolase, partial [Ilumatobacter sp.]|nr:class II fructose-bisphosphate aldolase [Ilumatobacter sp.]